MLRTLPRHTKVLHFAREERHACAGSESVDNGVSPARKHDGRGCCYCCYCCCDGRGQSKVGSEGLPHSHARCYLDRAPALPQSKCPNRKRHQEDPIRCSLPTGHAFWRGDLTRNLFLSFVSSFTHSIDQFAAVQTSSGWTFRFREGNRQISKPWHDRLTWRKRRRSSHAENRIRIRKSFGFD